MAALFLWLKLGGSGALEEVIECTPLSGEQRTLFEEDRISRFARNGDFLAAVLPHESSDELRVVPIGPGEGETVELPPGARISDLEFSPTDGQLVFLTEAKDGSERDSGSLYRHDAGGGRSRPVELPEGEEGFSDALYSRDGEAGAGAATRRHRDDHLDPDLPAQQRRAHLQAGFRGP